MERLTNLIQRVGLYASANEVPIDAVVIGWSRELTRTSRLSPRSGGCRHTAPGVQLKYDCRQSEGDRKSFAITASANNPACDLQTALNRERTANCGRNGANEQVSEGCK